MKIRERLILCFVSTFLLLAFLSYNSKAAKLEVRSSALVKSEKFKQEIEGASGMLLALQATQIPIHVIDKPSIPLATQKQIFTKIDHKSVQIKTLFAQIESSLLLSRQARYEIDKYISLNNINKEKQWYKHIHLFNYLQIELLISKFNVLKLINCETKTSKISKILNLNLEEQYTTNLLSQLNKSKNGREQEIVTQSNQVIKDFNAAEQQILIATVFGLISAVLTSTLISRSILKPLNKLKEAAEKVGQGGFHTRVDIRSRNEVEVLANAFNQMIDDLSQTTVTKSYLDQIINSMTDSLIVVNLATNITRVNQATVKLLGYKDSELIGQKYSIIINLSFQLLQLDKLKEKGAIANLETVYLTKDGRHIPVSFSASVMQDANQQIQGIVCIAHDLTEHKEAEKLNTLLATAVDSAADAIEITNASATFEYVNPAFEKVTGYKYSDVIGKTSASLLRSGEHDAAFYQQISTTLASGKVWSGCYIGKRKNGTLYHQEVTISPVSNAAGVITHHVAVKRDITQRKQVEEALQESQANLSALIENTQNAVWSVDTEYKVVTINANFKQQFLLAYGIELKIGMNIVECLLPEYRAVWERYYKCALAGNRFCFEQHYEFSGVPVDIEFSFNPIFTEDSKVIGVSAFGRNITEHKRAQERLKKINECFLSFGIDPVENINRLTALCGELLGAAFTLYSDIEEGMLCCVGQWQAPANYNHKDKPEGHICYDVTLQSSDEIFVVHDLPNTKYAQTDSNVKAYKLQTYIGKAVKCRHIVGTLCALYQKNYIPTEDDRKVISIIAAAIGVEEERRATQTSLRESEERYALAVNAANDGLWDWNLKTNKVYFSPRSKALLGCNEAEIGDGWSEFFQRVYPEDINSLKKAIATHLEGHSTHFECEYRVLHQDGLRWILCRGLAVRDKQGKPVRLAGSQTDITERKSAEAQLQYQAFHDALTKLPNRLLFIQRLEYALLRSKQVEDYQFAVLFLDLDRFKVVNDSLGHNIGDQLLIAIASKLQACIRPGDTVSRLGGDEFTILLEDIKDISEAAQVANRILQYLSMPFGLSGHEVFTTTSIGIAISHSGYEQPEDLLRDADTAMYRAKALGKARFAIFDPTLHNQAMARLQLEIDLRRALERQELQVYYQPIVSLNNSKITGFEALVRWQHPEKGFVSPATFIPVAEETGLIIALDLWVLRQACQQMRSWQQLFPLTPPLTISVNLSGKQLAQPNVVQKIEQILQQTGFDARNLKLEITESVLVENAADAAAILGQLKALGIGLSIDDFGTGYSSLSYLHRLPIDTLKIDRSFVNDVDCDPEKIEIIRTVVGLAWNLSMDIVAEGVETKKQMYQLQALRCEYGQGYLFSKPVDSQKAEALLSEQWICDKDLRLATI